MQALLGAKSGVEPLVADSGPVLAAWFAAAAAANPQRTEAQDVPGAAEAFSQLAGASKNYR